MTSSRSEQKEGESPPTISRRYGVPEQISESTGSRQYQSIPITFATDHKATSAQVYLQQAELAFHTHQWQSASHFAKLCVAVAQNNTTHFSAISFYAKSLLMMNQTEEALPMLLELNAGIPDNANTLVNIGLAFIKLNRFGEAIEYLQRTITLTPNDALAHLDLGFAFAENGNLERAKTSYLQAVKLDPTLVPALFSLGKMLLDEGLVDEAQQTNEQALELGPNNLDTLSHIGYILSTQYPLDMQSQFEIARRFRLAIDKDKVLLIQPTEKQLHPHTPLRIGFVSADLNAHPVGYFLESTLDQLRFDPILCSKLHLTAYYNHEKQDEYTQRLQTHFDSWYRVDEWSDDRLVEQIKQDQIDILVDLSGYTYGDRLSVFASKAAPLQISWLGYWGSTGLSAIDYVLADPICVPPDEEKWFFEKIWRLPSLRYCFSIPEDAPEVSSLPCANRQQVVFGCYQQSAKINRGVLQCWARILTASPHARLRIQAKGLEKPEIKNQFTLRLQKLGIDFHKVDLVGTMARREYLASYAEVDILLDTFPHPGGTTTAEALWMGVPTITLALPSMLGRQGEALLINAGLSDWITSSEDHYVQKAIAWANSDMNQRWKLEKIRLGMREIVRLSPVFGANQFARDFVSALYAMWEDKFPQ